MNVICEGCGNKGSISRMTFKGGKTLCNGCSPVNYAGVRNMDICGGDQGAVVGLLGLDRGYQTSIGSGNNLLTQMIRMELMKKALEKEGEILITLAKRSEKNGGLGFAESKKTGQICNADGKCTIKTKQNW